MSGVPVALVLVVWSDPAGWPSPSLQAYSYPHTALQVIHVLIHIFKKRYSVQCPCTVLLDPVSEKLLIMYLTNVIPLRHIPILCTYCHAQVPPEHFSSTGSFKEH